MRINSFDDANVSLLIDVNDNEYIPYMQEQFDFDSVLLPYPSLSEIYSLHQDPATKRLYVCGGNTLYCFDESGKLLASASGGLSSARSMAFDDDYAYGTTVNVVIKINKHDLTTIASYPSVDTYTDRGIAVDAEHVYVGVVNEVFKLRKSDLSYVSKTGNYGGSINSLCLLNGFLYVGGAVANPQLKKYSASTMSLIGSSPAISTTDSNGIAWVGTDGDLVYYSTPTGASIKITKLDPATMTNIKSIGGNEAYGNMSMSGDWIYCQSSVSPLSTNPRYVSKIRKSDMTVVESVSLEVDGNYYSSYKSGNQISAIEDSPYIYVNTRLGIASPYTYAVARIAKGYKVAGYKKL